MSELLKNKVFFNGVLKAFSANYSEGLKDKDIWDRADGDKSCVDLRGSGHRQWRGAFKELKKGSDSVSLEDLFDEALHDYPKNPAFIALQAELEAYHKEADTFDETDSYLPISSAELPEGSRDTPWQEVLALFSRSEACRTVNTKLRKSCDSVIVTGRPCDQPSLFTNTVVGIIKQRKFQDSHYVPIFIELDLRGLKTQASFYILLREVDEALWLNPSIDDKERFVEDEEKDEESNQAILEALVVKRLHSIVKFYQEAQVLHLVFRHQLRDNKGETLSSLHDQQMIQNWRRLINKTLTASEPFQGHLQVLLLFNNTVDKKHSQAGEVTDKHIYLSELRCNEGIISDWQQDLLKYFTATSQHNWSELLKSLRRHFKVPLLPLYRRLSFQTLINKLEND